MRELPEQFTDERVAEVASTLVSGIASVGDVAVLAIAVLIDGENLLARFRRLLPPARRAQADAVGGVVYRTLGRYFGGSITVADPDGAVGARARACCSASRSLRWRRSGRCSPT